jgi:hypothetical protein
MRRRRGERFGDFPDGSVASPYRPGQCLTAKERPAPALLMFVALTRARGARAGRPTRIGRGCAEQSDRLEPGLPGT